MWSSTTVSKSKGPAPSAATSERCQVNAVEARSVGLRYRSRTALQPSDFTIEQGTVAALIGPNGSGKSTVLNAISGLHPPEVGSLTVLGRPPVESRSRIAYVLQSTTVNEALPVTVREVVAMGRYASLGMVRRFGAADRTAVETAMDQAEVSDLATRQLADLSGGQRQRVFVAQGLAQDRDLLLLDEPLTGLDLVSMEIILGVVSRERAAGRTVIMTTHDLGDASQTDHVILLAGRVVAEGPPGEVLTADLLSDAYAHRIVAMEGRVMVDDPAHQPSDRRHVHLDRSKGGVARN